MAAMDPVGNEKQGRTSSVFSTLLDDFETTPGIVLHSVESTNWNCNWIINRKFRVSNLKNFIRFIRNSNIECNNLFARKSWKIRFEQISKPLFFTVTKLAPSSTRHRITVFLVLATDSFTAGRKQIRRKTLRCPWALRQYLRPHGE